MDATYLFLLFVYFVPPPARDDAAPCQLQRFRKLLWKKADGRKEGAEGLARTRWRLELHCQHEMLKQDLKPVTRRQIGNDMKTIDT